MAIYLRGGMPIALTAAERRMFWRIESRNGNVTIARKEPTLDQVKKAGAVEIGWIWFATATCQGKYPDGSGYEKVGDAIEGMAEADGFICTNDMRADDGIREIYDTCKNLQSQPEEGFISETYAPAYDRLMVMVNQVQASADNAKLQRAFNTSQRGKKLRLG